MTRSTYDRPAAFETIAVHCFPSRLSLLFAWLIADGDMHLKNLVLLKIAEPEAKASTSVRFAPYMMCSRHGSSRVLVVTAWRSSSPTRMIEMLPAFGDLWIDAVLNENFDDWSRPTQGA